MPAAAQRLDLFPAPAEDKGSPPLSRTTVQPRRARFDQHARDFVLSEFVRRAFLPT
jgi:hypothetical protein